MIEQQIAAVRAELETRPKGLVNHVTRVLAEAFDIGSRYDLDPARIELATWGHDLFRAHSAEEQLRLARECGIQIDETEERLPVLLHGPIATVVLRERFGLTDEEGLAAVRDHTSGLAEMPLLAKVILLADKVEKHKRERTPAMAEIRKLARRDLDLALLCWADWKWVDERTRRYEAHAAHWQARVAWVAAHHGEAGMPGRVSARAFAKEAAADQGD
ncbi:MAG TPA: bis(5'-nucleosyl)-tetraphosphatase (symmetrical) YqeK [Tepidiformaceae bacterium]